MPVLSNPRYERMAQELAKGLPNSQAFINAGFKAHSGNAHRLSNHESVRARVTELQNLSAARIVNEAVNKDWVLKKAKKLADTCETALDQEFAPATANVNVRAIELIGRHVDVQAWKDTTEHNVHITIDAAIGKLDAIEGEYSVVEDKMSHTDE